MSESLSFHPFPRLPAELQLHILTFCAVPCLNENIDSLDRYNNANIGAMITIAGRLISLSPHAAILPHNSLFTITSVNETLGYNLLCNAHANGLSSRVNMMEATQLTRLVALEAWKKDFQTHSENFSDENSEEKQNFVAGKAAMIRSLNEMITELTRTERH